MKTEDTKNKQANGAIVAPGTGAAGELNCC